MIALENSVFIEILKKIQPLFTYIDDFSLRILCYTPFGKPKYRNH